MTEKLILHEYASSGNCYKVRLTAAIVGKHLERREYDIMMSRAFRPSATQRKRKNWSMNQQLNDDIETVFLMADASLQPIASNLVKEIARYGGSIAKFVTPAVADDVKRHLDGHSR